MNPRILNALLAGALLSITALSAFASGSQDDKPASQAHSAAALYDQGNAAARAGKPAEAVLDYERAALIAPRDPDIRANLQHVRTQAGLAIPGNWFTQNARIANPNLMFWLATLGIALTGASLVARRSRKTQREPLAVTAVFGIVLTLAGVTDAIATGATLNEAVVMQASSASGAPITAAEALFTVPKADVVRMIEDHGDFILVRDARHREGWLARSVLSPIIPRAKSQ
jgi:hypothetical protein